MTSPSSASSSSMWVHGWGVAGMALVTHHRVVKPSLWCKHADGRLGGAHLPMACPMPHQVAQYVNMDACRAIELRVGKLVSCSHAPSDPHSAARLEYWKIYWTLPCDICLQYVKLCKPPPHKHCPSTPPRNIAPQSPPKTLQIPTCLVSLVDNDRLWFKSKAGFPPEVTQVDRTSTFCAWWVT